MTDFENTTEHQVAMRSHALQCAISDLWRMRLVPETADQVLREEGSLLACLGSLHVLCDDIRKSYDKRQTIQAAE